ncbi:MAG TPA: hypothetical protein VF529_21965 [Solirubrobacteraceae bacterium]|jgi:hypothetical protein
MRRARRIAAAGAAACAVVPAAAGADVETTVDTSADRHPISPLVYGVNASAREGAAFSSLLSFARPGLVRLGGNQNDGYLSASSEPGAAVLPSV